MGRVSLVLGFVATDWESHAIHPFRLSLTTSGSYAMQRSI